MRNASQPPVERPNGRNLIDFRPSPQEESSTFRPDPVQTPLFNEEKRLLLALAAMRKDFRDNAKLPPSTTPFKRFAAWIASGIAAFAFSLKVRGLENLPPHEPFIICANHSSHLDTFVTVVALGSQRNRLVFMGASDYFFDNAWRRFFYRNLISLVPFDRSGTISATQSNLDYLQMCKAENRVVVIYPEGTRTRTGQMGEFKRGVAFFARKLGMRVVPCRIEGTFRALPPTKFFPAFTPLKITFGKPICIEDFADNLDAGQKRSDLYDAFTNRLRNEIENLGTVVESNGVLTR